MRTPRLVARPRGALLVVALVGLASVPVGWTVSDRLEQDNDFCNACHLEPGVPLHVEIRRDFDRAVPASLAGAHAGARVPANGSGTQRAFRCIDCHGGASLLGRVRVKALAAKDAFWYVVGRFEEPDGMRWPLWDEDCARCHTSFDEDEPEPWESPHFHQLPVHNVDLGVACVECHFAHEMDGNADAYFLHTKRVRGQCARCHAEFEDSRNEEDG